MRRPGEGHRIKRRLATGPGSPQSSQFPLRSLFFHSRIDEIDARPLAVEDFHVRHRSEVADRAEVFHDVNVLLTGWHAGHVLALRVGSRSLNPCSRLGMGRTVDADVDPGLRLAVFSDTTSKNSTRNELEIRPRLYGKRDCATVGANLKKNVPRNVATAQGTTVRVTLRSTPRIRAQIVIVLSMRVPRV